MKTFKLLITVILAFRNPDDPRMPSLCHLNSTYLHLCCTVVNAMALELIFAFIEKLAAVCRFHRDIRICHWVAVLTFRFRYYCRYGLHVGLLQRTFKTYT